MLYERQAPINESGETAAWADNNFSGLYTAATDSYLAAHWVQDFEDVNQTLNVMWQQPNSSAGLTIGQYTSYLNNSVEVSNAWVFTNLNTSVPDGSTFALSHYGMEDYLRVYTTSIQDTVQQSVYYAGNYSITDTLGKQRPLSISCALLTVASSDGLQPHSRCSHHRLDPR